MRDGTAIALCIAFGSALVAAFLEVPLVAVVFFVAGLAVIQEARTDGS